MPAKKVKKFCRLAKFLEQSDKDLYQAFDDLCLLGLFRVRGRGLTFLYPADKAYRKKIIDHAYSNNPEKAVEMVKCLVLLDFLPNSSDFNSKKDDIPNSHHKKLEVESADSKEVKLKSGHKLVVDKTYIPLRSGEPIAVYQLTGKGELPTTGTSSAMKYNNESSGNKRGGYVQGGGPGDFNKSDVIKLTKCVENHYAKGNHEIYRCILSMIYDYAMNDACDNNTKYDIYKRICASPRASFYSILSPWSLEKNYNIGNLITSSGLSDLVNCNELTISQLIVTITNRNLYNINLDKLIVQCRLMDKSFNDLNTHIVNRQTNRGNLLKNRVTSPTSAKSEILSVYGSDTSALYKDLVTVYCYLSATHEENDSSYYKISFTYAMENIFNHTNSFNESVNQTAYNLSIYYNLLKSDAFLYIPLLTTESTSVSEYLDLSGKLPDPNKDDLFGIQFSDLAKKGGGGGCDGSTYFGGIVNSL